MFGNRQQSHHNQGVPQHGPPQRKSSFSKIPKFFKSLHRAIELAVNIALCVAALNALSTYGFSLDAIGGFLNIMGAYTVSAGEAMGVFGLEINSSLDSVTQALGGIADSASSIDLGFK